MKKKHENSPSLCQRLYDALNDTPEPRFVATESKRASLREELLESLVGYDDIVEFDADTEAKKWARYQQCHKPSRTIHQTVLEAITQ